MKLAILDLGTNTFRLLIVDTNPDGYREILKKSIHVQLGQGGLAHARITPEAQQRAIEAMTSFKEIIDQQGIQHVYAVATSAIRTASNGQEVIARIRQYTGITVKVICGSQEASLIYQGVRASLALGPELALIMDIGGGSVEFILCNDQQALWQQSFEIGAQRLLDKFHHHDPILPDELEQLEAYLEATLHPLFQAIKIYKPTKLIGTSGAFNTLVSMHQAATTTQQDSKEVVYELPLAYFKQSYQDLCYTTIAERLKIPGLANEKADMLVVSLALIHFILQKSPISKLLVSNYSLKVGVFLQAIEDMKNKGMITPL